MWVTDIRTLAERWRAADPDPDNVAELTELLEGSDNPLVERFTGRLQFGTAGLRGPIGAGPNRMNRLVVRQAAAGLGKYLLEYVPGAADAGVLIGFDARPQSDVFALDSARVLAQMGVRVQIFDQVTPTPVVAWSIMETGSAAGIVVTASHNPPADNGYKVYLGGGAQIVPPADLNIAACIDLFDPTSVVLAPEDHQRISTVGDELFHAYIAGVQDVRHRPDVAGVPVAYTAMHGVGAETVERSFVAAGFDPPIHVAEQHKPDGTFPTVSFPNPEEPGAMDRVIALADTHRCHLALANDPDADRLGVAIPTPQGGWRRLGGDEIGALLADHILSHTSGDDRLVVTTLVSSSLLAKMAAAYGVSARETFTGFKWIARTAQEHPDLRFVFGYEQALGYLVTDRPLDKDGVTAAVLMAEIAALAAAEGVTVQDRLDNIAERFGAHIQAEHAVWMTPDDAASVVGTLRVDRPETIGGYRVVGVEEYPEANLLRFELEAGLRVQVRPSGTEPKVKLYGEGVGVDPAPVVAALAALIEAG